MASTPVLSSGLSKTGSSGNLLASNTIPRGTGASSMKLYSAVSGNHLSSKVSSSNAPSSIPALNTIDGASAKLLLNDSGDVINNNIISSNLSGISDSGHSVSLVGIPHSTSMIITQNPQSPNQSGQLDDSDAASSDSIPRSQSHPVLPKGQLVRNPEVDVSSRESLDSSRGGGLEKVSEKRQKKKKFLPNFFLKNKGKQKTS